MPLLHKQQRFKLFKCSSNGSKERRVYFTVSLYQFLPPSRCSSCNCRFVHPVWHLLAPTLDTVGGIVADGPQVAQDESLNQNDGEHIIYHLPSIPPAPCTPSRPSPLSQLLSVSRGPLVTLKYLMASLAVDRRGGSAALRLAASSR